MFDFTKVQSRDNNFEPIPEGKYHLRIDNLEIRTSKAGKEYLKAKCVVTDPGYMGRVVFHNFNLNSDNDMARAIAMGDIKIILEANKKTLKVKDMDHLISLLQGSRIGARIKIREQEGHSPQNEVKWFFAPEVKARSSAPVFHDPFDWASKKEDEEAPF